MTLPAEAARMLAGRPAPDLSRLSIADRNAYEALYRLSQTLANRGKDLSAFMIEGAMLALLSEPGTSTEDGAKARYGEIN